MLPNTTMLRRAASYMGALRLTSSGTAITPTQSRPGLCQGFVVESLGLDGGRVLKNGLTGPGPG
jgi:hypothetical protein